MGNQNWLLVCLNCKFDEVLRYDFLSMMCSLVGQAPAYCVPFCSPLKMYPCIKWRASTYSLQIKKLHVHCMLSAEDKASTDHNQAEFNYILMR